MYYKGDLYCEKECDLCKDQIPVKSLQRVCAYFVNCVDVRSRFVVILTN